jgi:uncharacterized protein (TIGR03086 family)
MTCSVAQDDGMTITTNTGSRPDIRLAEDDPRALFGRAVALAGSVITSVTRDQLDGPTPCTEYDVRTLLGHLVSVLHRVAALGRDEDPFALPEVRVADDGWVEAWFDTAEDARSAWADDDTLTRIMRLPWAELPGAGMLTMYTCEVTLHTWDLATATGQHPAWDDRVVSVAYEAMRRALPGPGRTALLEAVVADMPEEHRDGGFPFAEPVDVPADAPLIDRLVGWSGRRP